MPRLDPLVQAFNAVTDELFALLRRHWSEEEIVEILAVVAMFGWNAGKHGR